MHATVTLPYRHDLGERPEAVAAPWTRAARAERWRRERLRARLARTAGLAGDAGRAVGRVRGRGGAAARRDVMTTAGRTG